MAKPVEENYLITIKGTMEQNGENDTVELMTRGNFVQRGNSYYIVYAETEATGYAGCTTTVRVSQDARLVSMTRFGKTSSQLIIEKGIRHLCHYETGYGSISLGVAADVIEHNLLPDGGELQFSYTLDNDQLCGCFSKLRRRPHLKLLTPNSSLLTSKLEVQRELQIL